MTKCDAWVLEDPFPGIDLNDLPRSMWKRAQAEIDDSPWDDGIVYEIFLSKLIFPDREVIFCARKPCCEWNEEPTNEVEFRRSILCQDINGTFWEVKLFDPLADW